MTETTTTKKARKQRSSEQRISELEAEIQRVREREAARSLRGDTAMKLTAQARPGTQQGARRGPGARAGEALAAAKGALAGYLESKGFHVPKPGKRRKTGTQVA